MGATARGCGFRWGDPSRFEKSITWTVQPGSGPWHCLIRCTAHIFSQIVALNELYLIALPWNWSVKPSRHTFSSKLQWFLRDSVSIFTFDFRRGALCLSAKFSKMPSCVSTSNSLGRVTGHKEQFKVCALCRCFYSQRRNVCALYFREYQELVVFPLPNF